MDLATRAVRDHIADPELLGPYRWGAPEAPVPAVEARI